MNAVGGDQKRAVRSEPLFYRVEQQHLQPAPVDR
jgi:hypothetical protein